MVNDKATTRRRMSRHGFLSGCAACAAYAAGGCVRVAKTPQARDADKKPKVRLVFCETENTKPIWPNIGYDFDHRRNQMIGVITRGCTEVEFLPTRLVEGTRKADDVLAGDAEVDGYVVCVQGLGWGNDLNKLCSTGKPTLLVDNLFGGSGLFLTQLPQIMRSGKPVDWVSSSNDEDIVASVRCFRSLARGESGEEVAAAFRASRRRNTPTVRDWACKRDAVATRDVEEALKQLGQTRILVAGGGWGGDNFRKAAAEVVGLQLIPIEFEELAGAYAEADTNAARAFADEWIDLAEDVLVERTEVEKSGAVYVAMKNLMAKHGASGVSVNCLGGFYEGHLQAYPCIGFSQLNNDGFVGGCEGDQMSALTMATMGALTGRPGLISDPVIDTSRNVIIYAHCVATTKPFGPDGESNGYQIMTHSEDRKGASIRSLLPEGYMTTSLEINPVSKRVIMHQAKTVGNNDSDMACRTKLEAVVKGDIEKLAEQWSMGWHRVTFYGDLKSPVEELCDRLSLKLIEEA